MWALLILKKRLLCSLAAAAADLCIKTGVRVSVGRRAIFSAGVSLCGCGLIGLPLCKSTCLLVISSPRELFTFLFFSSFFCLSGHFQVRQSGQEWRSGEFRAWGRLDQEHEKLPIRQQQDFDKLTCRWYRAGVLFTSPAPALSIIINILALAVDTGHNLTVPSCCFRLSPSPVSITMA